VCHKARRAVSARGLNLKCLAFARRESAAVPGGALSLGQLSAMNNYHHRYIKGAFLTTGKDIEARKFESSTDRYLAPSSK
jgi:hypothetical protein